jgi:hypothetical protein
MTPETKPAANSVVRFLLTAFPLGLVIMGALSFVIFFSKRNALLEPKASKYADMMQRDINAADLQRYAKILSTDIGERTPAQKDNLDTAASFMESTMGFDNMGYRVKRSEYLEEGNTITDLTADLVGKANPESVVLVIASYAGGKDDSASAPAALMSLAHQFTGTSHKRTLRFVAQGSLINRPPRFPKFVDIHPENVKSFEKTYHGVILYSGPSAASELSTLGPANDPASMKLTLWDIDVTGDPEKAVAHLRDIAKEISKLLD